MKQKKIKYVAIVAKVTPEIKATVEKVAAENDRTISQQLRSDLTKLYEVRI